MRLGLLFERRELMQIIGKSRKLDNVCYDIRGPVMDEAERMESLGEKILKLNIGNPAPFGFEAPEEIIRKMEARFFYLSENSKMISTAILHRIRILAWQITFHTTVPDQ